MTYFVTHYYHFNLKMQQIYDGHKIGGESSMPMRQFWSITDFLIKTGFVA